MLDGKVLKEQVKVALAQRRKQDDLESAIAALEKKVETVIEDSLATLNGIRHMVEKESAPVLVRIGKNLFVVALSPTQNIVEPVSIVAAQIAA